jgi:hypothetical protein
MHCAQHTSDELVDTVRLLDKWYQGCYPALVVRATSEVREDELLEGIDLIL